MGRLNPSPFILLYIILVLAVLNACNTDRLRHIETINLVAIPSAIKNSFKSGDIIVRKGGGALSYAIMNTTKEPYSHCGIIVRNHDSLTVIHAIADILSESNEDGVQAISLNNFVRLTTDSMLFVCRPIFEDSLGIKLANEAIIMLNKKLPYDHRYNLSSENKIYCSELIYRAFLNATGQNVFKIKKVGKLDILLFETFNDTTKFKMLYNLNGSKLKSVKMEFKP